MEAIKIVLVDDEAHCTASLAIHLAETGKPIVLCGVFNKPKEALAFLKTAEIDLLFLDIEMPLLNGFDLLNLLEEITFEVVFVTAYNQYAINAFKYTAFDYLLKPIDTPSLLQCLNRWEASQGKNTVKAQLQYLSTLIQQQHKVPEKLALPTNDGLEIVEISKIIRCQSDSNYTTFYFADGSQLLICRTLKDVEHTLTGNGFIRIHQSHLINPNFIKKLIKNDGGYLVMSDDSQLRISKNKKEVVMNAFNMIG